MSTQTSRTALVSRLKFVESGLMSTWDAFGLVVGERLPDDLLAIPGILTIRHGDPQEVESLKQLRVNVALDLRPPSPNHFDVSEAPVRVESQWLLEFELEADDWDAAMATAISTAALYESVLNTVTPEASKPFHVELLALVGRESGEGGPLPSTWNVYPVRVSSLTEDEAATLERRLTLIAEHGEAAASGTSRAAAQLLRDATYLADTSMEVALLQNASLLLYFQVVEGIAQYVVKAQSGEARDTLDAERSKLATDLVADLSAAATAGESSRLVHTADYELRQIEATHLRQRIVDAGEVLGLAQSEIDEAVALLGLRNKHVAHFGKTLPRKEFIYWFHQRKALRIALRFFSGLLDWESGVSDA